jgi:hypothetical protein
LKYTVAYTPHPDWQTMWTKQTGNGDANAVIMAAGSTTRLRMREFAVEVETIDKSYLPPADAHRTQHDSVGVATRRPHELFPCASRLTQVQGQKKQELPLKVRKNLSGVSDHVPRTVSKPKVNIAQAMLARASS